MMDDGFSVLIVLCIICLIGVIVLATFLPGDALPQACTVEVTFVDGHTTPLEGLDRVDYREIPKVLVFGRYGNRRMYPLKDVAEYRVILKKDRAEGE